MIGAILKYGPIQAVSAISIFGLIALHTRNLDMPTYGLLTLFLVSMDLVRSLSSQWISSTLIRLYPSSTPQEQKALLATSNTMIWLLFVPGILAIVLSLLAFRATPNETWIFTAYLLISKSLHTHALEVSRILNNSISYRTITIQQSILSIVLTLVFLNISPKIESAILALALSYTIPWLLNFRTVPVHFDKPIARRIFSYGFPVLISSNISLISTRLDRFFIAEHLDLASVGYYAAISNLILGITALVFAVITLPTYPELSKFTNDRYALKEKHSHYLDLLLAITLPAIVGMCIVSDPLVKVILTKDYSNQGAELFWILSISAYLLNIKGHYLDHGLQFTLNTRFLPWISALGLAINISILLGSISSFGIYAAAWAWLISNIITMTGTYIASVKSGFEYKTGKNFLKILIATLGMLGVASLARFFISTNSNLMDLILVSAAGATSYTSILLFLNAFDLRIKILKKIRREF